MTILETKGKKGDGGHLLGQVIYLGKVLFATHIFPRTQARATFSYPEMRHRLEGEVGPTKGPSGVAGLLILRTLQIRSGQVCIALISNLCPRLLHLDVRFPAHRCPRPLLFAPLRTLHYRQTYKCQAANKLRSRLTLCEH